MTIITKSIYLSCLLPVIALSHEHNNSSIFSDYGVDVIGGAQMGYDKKNTGKIPVAPMFGLSGYTVINKDIRLDLGAQWSGTLKKERDDIRLDAQLSYLLGSYNYTSSKDTNINIGFGPAYWNIDLEKGVSKSKLSGMSPIFQSSFSHRLHNRIIGKIGYQYIYSLGNSRTGYFDSHSIFLGIGIRLGNQNKHKGKIYNLKNDPVQHNHYKDSREIHTGTILFGVDEYSATHVEKEKLNEISNYLHSLDYEPITLISGHTDDTGSYNYNLELSNKRANYISEFLNSTNPGITTISVGHGYLIPSTKSKTDKKYDRRAEIKISNRTDSMPLEFFDNDIIGSLLFNKNSFTLDELGINYVKNLVKVIAQLERVESIVVLGYTDNLESENNENLSQSRSDTVAGILEQMLPKLSISSKGKGEDLSKGGNSGTKRRVDILIYEGRN